MAAATDPDPLYRRWASWMRQQGDGVPTLPTPVQAIIGVLDRVRRRALLRDD